MQASNATRYRGVPSRLTEELAMKASDFDRQGGRGPGKPSDREWLHVVGLGVGLVLVCALWTLWAA
ncbi:MAG: hypothetical protein ACXWLB_10655 [Reyranella sp.]